MFSNVFFNIEMIKRFFCYDDSLLRFTHTSCETIKNYQRLKMVES